MRLVALLLICSAAFGQSLPDAPSASNLPLAFHDSRGTWHQLHKLPPKPSDGFFSFRKSWTAPALKPNKTSWAIWGLAHGAAWGSMVAACRNPRSGENWGSEVPAIAVITAFDYAMLKLLSPSFGTGPAVYGSAHYILSASK